MEKGKVVTGGRKKLTFAHLVGEGIGNDFGKALHIVLGGIPTIECKVVTINDFRLPTETGEPGSLDPAVIEIIKNEGEGTALKGPTRTGKGVGVSSVNVDIRSRMDLYSNERPAYYMDGVQSPIHHPEQVNIVVFRENTQDVYMGVEAKPGSENVAKLLEFLRKEWGYPLVMFTDDDEVGAGIKLISRRASERIMESAMQFAIKHSQKRVTIVHKGNIMKHTEGAFMNWCLAYAKEHYRDLVYFPEEEKMFSEEEKAGRILVNEIIADNALAQVVAKPSQFQVMVTMNLNGDYLSDLTAAIVGGVPVAAGANIGLDGAVFEAIGGTGDDIAGKNIANPTAFLLAFAMLLDYKCFYHEAKLLRDTLGELFKERIGTGDMKFEKTLSTTEFAQLVADRLSVKLLSPEIVEVG